MKRIIDFPLKEVSWIKIGGNAKEYIEADSKEELVAMITEVLDNSGHFEIIGWGANTLISDHGVDSVLIKNKSNKIDILEGFKPESPVEQKTSPDKEFARHKADPKMLEAGAKHALQYEDIYYDDSDEDNIYVRVDSGVGLPFIINNSISKGITGLQMFSGIPGTIGGSVFNNIHGGPRLISDFVYSAEVIDKDKKIFEINHKDLKFDYNDSIFKRNGYTILSIILQLKAGDKIKAQKASVGWAQKKAYQPKNSLGSVFHNLLKKDQEKLNMPTPSAGYFIDHILKLGGYRVGEVMIPEDLNKNIFVNLGNATANDFLSVMKKVYKEALERYDVKLKPEIYFKGFDPKEIEEFI